MAGAKPKTCPWRVRAGPVLVLDPEAFVPAEELVPELEAAAGSRAAAAG